jgi:hypothetical protein
VAAAFQKGAWAEAAVRQSSEAIRNWDSTAGNRIRPAEPAGEDLHDFSDMDRSLAGLVVAVVMASPPQLLGRRSTDQFFANLHRRGAHRLVRADR